MLDLLIIKPGPLLLNIIYAEGKTFDFIYCRVYVSLFKNEESGHYQKQDRVTNEDRQNEKGTRRQKILVV